ncbi:MAG: phosphate regulon sensor histidine kinase PhoR [Pseudomonadaceae bacterium]|nr:phosphate regulon sensor histidine kinase PhoR [Pseudomonadaceae bacterium]
MSEIAALGASIVLALLVGPALGLTPWLLLAIALAWIAYQSEQHRRFARWARHPLRRARGLAPNWAETAGSVHRSVHTARGRTRNILRRMAELQIVTEALPDAAVVIDSRGLITRYNPAAGRLLRLNGKDVGRDLLMLVRDPQLARLLDGGIDDHVLEIMSPFDAGVRLEVRVIDVSTRTRLVLVRDVSQLYRLLTMRQDFIANVSHELRTPLTVVAGYLETMTDEDVSDIDVQLLASKLVSPVHRMEALVGDLLLLTRLEASSPPSDSELEAIDVASLAQAVVREAEGLSDGRHEFRLELHSDVRIRGVSKELHSALMNLVSNAVRYSPKGGVITVSFEQSESGAHLAVSDDGMGIAPEHISRLTERFYRVDLAAARVRGGTGLGLAIVKHVLKRHHSTLSIQSELGQGSRFCCDFPSTQTLPANDVSLLEASPEIDGY